MATKDNNKMKSFLDEGEQPDDASGSEVNISDANSAAQAGDLDSSSAFVRMSTASLQQTTPAAPKLARQETKAVHTLRIITLLVILGAAIAVASFMYVYMHGVEQDAFENNFEDLSRRLVQGFHANAKLRVQTMDLFASSLTSTVIATNQTWPTVAIPHFEAKGAAARAIVSSDYIGLYPVVTRETREIWEEYTLENTAFLNESFAYQQSFKNHYGYSIGARAPVWRRRGRRDLATLNFDELFQPSVGEGQATESPEQEDVLLGEVPAMVDEPLGIDEDEIAPEEQPAFRESVFDGPDNITTELYRYGTDEEGVLFVVDESDGPYFPMFQVSPTRENSYIDVNYNFNDPFYAPAFTQGLLLAYESGTAVFAGVWNVDDEGYIDEEDDYDFRTVPALSLFYPVFDKIEFEDRTVVGMIDLDIEFGPLASSVLPPNSNELVLVVENPCNQTFSYSVTGQRATYLGPEDLHDTQFDDMKYQALLTDFYDQGRGGAVYNGVPVNTDFCQWKITIYGTKDLEDAYLTNLPIVYTCVVLGIFLFTCLVFVFYDRLVEMRQKKVMKTAVNSEKIVNSLFPEEFKEKLYENNNNNNKESAFSDSKRVDAFIESSKEFIESSKEFLAGTRPSQIATRSPAMAQLYGNCSVYFADIAGFTSWSSSRSPADVFMLLETLYGSFDKIAKKYKVFKIETIGDCYVAVTGLPEPRKDHALLMVRFARDCLVKVRKLVRLLESKLGPETSDLDIRVGIHSGAVTAGVLRGEKARFQLFGDTVNTAARMETNGIRGQIHVSKATADLIVASGKRVWVHAREEMIIAKGKGAMQTFFIRPPGIVGSTARSSVANSTSSGGSSDLDEEAGNDIQMAIEEMAGAEKTKKDWIGENQRRLKWLSDLFKAELKKLLSLRGKTRSSTAGIIGQINPLPDRIVWEKGLVKSLLMPPSGEVDILQELPGDVDGQVLGLISMLAFSFEDLPYHNFNHSCLVILCLQQMLAKIDEELAPAFSISPFTKLACLFSALIRNIRPRLQNQSWTESRSAEIAFNALLDEKFRALRRALFPSDLDFNLFRYLVNNLLLATFASTDQGIAKDCDARWDDAFGENDTRAGPQQQILPIIEQTILIAQHAHSMQSWENYVTWSMKLLEESQQQYQEGTIHFDPTSTWYQKAMQYFDKFLIPVATKVDEAGFLGSLGSEYLVRAVDNRHHWESAGKDILRNISSTETENVSKSVSKTFAPRGSIYLKDE